MNDLFTRTSHFLSPSKLGLAFFFCLMGLLNIIAIYSGTILDARVLVGFPYGFFPRGYDSFLGGTHPPVTFSLPIFLFDCVFWWIISSALATVCRHRAKRTILLAALPLAGALLAIFMGWGSGQHMDIVLTATAMLTAVFVGVFPVNENGAPAN